MGRETVDREDRDSRPMQLRLNRKIGPFKAPRMARECVLITASSSEHPEHARYTRGTIFARGQCALRDLRKLHVVFPAPFRRTLINPDR